MLCRLNKPELMLIFGLANHPFYTNSQTVIDTEGRVERFMKKYGLNSQQNNK